jgi:hypothetical protein
MENEKVVEQNPSRNNLNIGEGKSHEKKFDSQSDPAKRLDSQEDDTDSSELSDSQVGESREFSGEGKKAQDI